MDMIERLLFFQVLAGRGSDPALGEVSDDVWQIRESEGVCYKLSDMLL